MVSHVAITDVPVLDRFRVLENVLPGAEVGFEAERCFYCYEAPCTKACPAEIDIPAFIRAIALEQPSRAASIILRENPLGMSCARVCPVETLCEAVCVRAQEKEGPVRIGLLQRAAMDVGAFQSQKSPSKKLEVQKVAIIGAGPAGMTLASLLACQGVSVDIFDAANVPGGLNETGIAAYKMLDDAAQKEARFLLDQPNIRFFGQSSLGDQLSLSNLRQEYDEVCLTIGLAEQRRLDIPGEALSGVQPAVPFIAALRRGERLPVGNNVLVVGGGMTAIDIAVQMRLLGAENVHIVYRRNIDDMGASSHERQLARAQGVLIHPRLRPVEIRFSAEGGLQLQLQAVQQQDGIWTDHGPSQWWSADQIFTAIGQSLNRENWDRDSLLAALALNSQGKIAVDEYGRTNISRVWAAGDCAGARPDLTVNAVADAKVVARSMMTSWKQETL